MPSARESATGYCAFSLSAKFSSTSGAMIAVTAQGFFPSLV